MQSVLFKLSTEPMVGDAHLGNILISGDRVISVDLEDIRGGKLEAGHDWEKMAWVRKQKVILF